MSVVSDFPVASYNNSVDERASIGLLAASSGEGGGGMGMGGIPNVDLLHALLEIEKRTSMQSALMRSLESERDQLQQMVHRLQLENEALKREVAQVSELRDKIAHETGTKGALQVEVAAQQRALEQLRENHRLELAESHASMRKLTSQLSAAKEEMAELQQHYQREGERVENERDAHAQRAAQLMSELANAKTMLGRAEERNAQLQVHTDKWRLRCEEMEVAGEQLSQRCTSLEAEVAAVTSRAESAEARLEQVRSDALETSQQLYAVRAELHHTKAHSQRMGTENGALQAVVKSLQDKMEQIKQEPTEDLRRRFDDASAELKRTREKLVHAERRTEDLLEINGAMQARTTAHDRDVFISLQEVTSGATRRIAAWQCLHASSSALVAAVGAVERALSGSTTLIGGDDSEFNGNMETAAAIIREADAVHDRTMMEDLDAAVTCMGRLCCNEGSDPRQRLEAISKAIAHEQRLITCTSERLDECTDAIRGCAEVAVSARENKAARQAANKLSDVIQGLHARCQQLARSDAT